MPFLRHTAIIAAICFVPFAAQATQAKIDPDACTALRLEQIKFRQSGILDDMSKGAEWAKANLSADRLREIEHYMQLDEQVKFGCRDAKLSPEAERASEAAARIEINSDADPTAPQASDPPKPGAPDKKDGPKKASKKTKAATQSDRPKKKKKALQEDGAAQPPVVVQSASESVTSAPAETSSVSSSPAAQDPALPAFGFGETTVLPHSAP